MQRMMLPGQENMAYEGDRREGEGQRTDRASAAACKVGQRKGGQAQGACHSHPR